MLSPSTLTFCLLSFEGPDRYALAGGLGVRIKHLSETLARRCFDTHLLFVGDPGLPGREQRLDGHLTLHRWCQWISDHHPTGVYAAEEQKLQDFNKSAPEFVIREIIRPAVSSGHFVVVMAEEWHTAEALIRLHRQLQETGLRHRCVLLWNANNTMSFHRVDWPRLVEAAWLTTVSRYMKHLMWGMELNPLVIPNGIPGELLDLVDSKQVGDLWSTFDAQDDTVKLFKVGRFDPAKRWLMAVEAAARLKADGYRVVFPLLGGIEPHGAEVLAKAEALGLSIAHLGDQPNSWADLVGQLATAPPAELYNLRFYLTQEMLRPFYAGADAVLANSGHEPFGLVGLEAMAAGGLVFTGTTGEEYTLGGQCAIALDTDSPDEIVSQILGLKDKPGRSESMREAARKRAAAFTWDQVVSILLDKIQFVAHASGMLPRANGNGSRIQRRVRDVMVYAVVRGPQGMDREVVSNANRSLVDVTHSSFGTNEALENRFREAAADCYRPTIQGLIPLLDQGFKLAISFQPRFIALARQWENELFEYFHRLILHDNAELLANAMVGDMATIDTKHAVGQLLRAADALEQDFGVRALVADATELEMSAGLYQALDFAGFEASLVNGKSQLLEWRQPNYLYHHSKGKLKLLTHHQQLSEDVDQRFFDREWENWPLTASSYAKWLAEAPGDLIVLGWEFETIGKNHQTDSGILGFLNALSGEMCQNGLSFITPCEAIERYGRGSHHLPLF